VADNLDKWDVTESVTTDIQTAPNDNLYVVSSTKGALYEISRRE